MNGTVSLTRDIALGVIMRVFKVGILALFMLLRVTARSAVSLNRLVIDATRILTALHDFIFQDTRHSYSGNVGNNFTQVLTEERTDLGVVS